MLWLHEPKCGNDDKTTIRTSLESHLHWKDHFHEKSFYFGIYPDFEADNEIYNFSISKKTTNIYKQNPVCNGYRIVYELEDVLKSGY